MSPSLQQKLKSCKHLIAEWLYKDLDPALLHALVAVVYLISVCLTESDRC